MTCILLLSFCVWFLLISKESINTKKNVPKIQPCLPDSLECDSLTKATNGTMAVNMTLHNDPGVGVIDSLLLDV